MKFITKQTIIAILIIIAISIFLGMTTFRIMEQVTGKKVIVDKTGFQTQKIVSEESVVIDVVKKVSPSVVSIAVDRVLLNPFDPNSVPRSQQSGIGTGFIIRSDGLILTNKHVVSDIKRKYFVVIQDKDNKQQKIEVREISRDPFNDLAIIKIDPPEGVNLPAAELGDSSKLQVGQLVVAIGNALGRFDNTVTKGVISGLGRGVTPIDPATGIAERLDDLIQTDAAINPGNSGGPLVNSGGQVIGVNTATAGAENIGFAIPVNIAKALISDFEATGKISRPFLGVRYSYISKDIALINEVPEGELVREVVSGSAAGKVGVKVGDIITHIDGAKLTEEKTLADIIRTKKVGDKMTLKIWRDGKTREVSATLGEASGE